MVKKSTHEMAALLSIKKKSELRRIHLGSVDSKQECSELYIHVIVHCDKFLFNNQPDASNIQIYSVIKLYMFRASSLPIIWSSLLYIRHW